MLLSLLLSASAMPVLSQVSAGQSSTCALHADGRLWCWGGMTREQFKAQELPTVMSPEPAPVPDKVLRVDVGNETCVVTDRHRVQCWGVGDQPRDLGLKGIQSGSVGNGHACALDKRHRVWCWGYNARGQVGDGTTENQVDPFRLELGNISQVDAGEYHTCVLHDDASVSCWGNNSGGQLGLGYESDAVKTPTHVPELGMVLSITAGNFHTCAMQLGGTVYCWGKNGVGQLGDGSGQHSPVPVAVGHLNRAISLDAGLDHTCATTLDGQVRCWGGNFKGQTGNPSHQNQWLPWRVKGMDPAVTVATGSQHTCVLTAPGDLVCWGQNFSGQLGIGTRESHREPVRVEGAWWQ